VIVVIGAAGLTGGAIVQALAQSGRSVRAVMRRSDAVAPEATEAVVADLRDPQAVGRAIAGAQTVIHVAGVLLGPELARVPGLGDLQRLIVVSSAGVYSRHRQSAAAYAAGEAAIRAARPDATIIRPTMIYGSRRDRNVHHVLRFAHRWRVLPLIGAGQALVQPIHYRDLAGAVASLAADASGLDLDAGGGSALTIRDAAVAIFDALGRPTRLIRLPLGTTARLIEFLGHPRGSRFAERIRRFGEDRSVDNRRLIALTGVTPRHFPDGVAELAREMGLT